MLNEQVMDVVGYRRMVAKSAIQCWWRLPLQVRAHVDVEDLIQEGLIFARFELAKKYSPIYGKFTTYLMASLPSYYANMVTHWKYQRYALEASTRSLQDVPLYEEPCYFERPCEDLHFHVVAMFVRVYDEASDSLRVSMRRWFLTKNNDSRVHIRSVKFLKDKKEFRLLAEKHSLQRLDCEIVMGSERAQRQILKRLPDENFIAVGV